MAVVRTFRPVWSEEACLPCGACTRRCPSSVFPEQAAEMDSLRGRVIRAVNFPPGPRPHVSPCQAACPLGQEVPGYTRAIAAGDFDRALEIICRSNPFPASLGRLCVRGCEKACVRAAISAAGECQGGAALLNGSLPSAARPLRGLVLRIASPARAAPHLDAVPIRALKRAAEEFGRRPSPWMPVKERGLAVAVVGAGPAGLSAAAALRRAGFSVEVFERESRPGGLLRLVPADDLPPEVLERDIEFIRAAGVKITCGAAITTADDFARLREKFAAVIVATGAGRGLVPEMPGRDLAGCQDALSFCREAEKLSGPVVVAGDGVVALSAARLAKRAGAVRVTWVVRRPREDLGVDPQKLDAALREGVELLECHAVERLEGQGRVERVRCRKLSPSAPDAVGRRLALPSPGAESKVVPAVLFVSAGMRESDLGFLPEAEFPRGPLGLIAQDDAGRTAQAGVYFAGEAAFGERNLVGAVASGLRAAAQAAGDLLRGEK